MSKAALLARAAAAYQRAGSTDAAARCYDEAGDNVAAAGTYLRLRRFERAASQYILGARSDMAAWVYAHHLRRTDIARDIAADFGRSRTCLRRVYEEIALRNLTRLLPETWPLLPADTDVDASVSTTLAEIHRYLRVSPLHRRALVDPVPSPVLVQFNERLQLWCEGRAEVEPTVNDLTRRLIIARCDVADRVHHCDVLPVLAASRAALITSEAFDATIEEWSIAIAEETHRYDQAALIFAAAVQAGSPGAATRWQEWAARVLEVELTLPGIDGRGVRRD